MRLVLCWFVGAVILTGIFVLLIVAAIAYLFHNENYDTDSF